MKYLQERFSVPVGADLKPRRRTPPGEATLIGCPVCCRFAPAGETHVRYGDENEVVKRICFGLNLVEDR